MPFSGTKSRPTPAVLGGLAAVSALVLIVGVIRDYSFLPNRVSDGFLDQIEYAASILTTDGWGFLFSDPLSVVHVMRYLLVWPFLRAEEMFGPAGGLASVQLLIWPLVFTFRPQRGDWRDIAFFGVRLLVLFLPLFVSGRTVLVIAGMGYLVSGIMMRPFSRGRMLIGCLLAALSSASVLFSIAILVVSGNWRGRSRAFYVAKTLFLILVLLIFVPSLFAKAEGFSTGAAGYAAESSPDNSDSFGFGPLAAVERIIMRSTLVNSLLENNLTRVALYAGLFLAAWAYILWSAAVRHWNPMLIVLVVLSAGILLEGLALWPILFPLVWAYTGLVRTDRTTGLRSALKPAYPSISAPTP